MNRRSEKLIVHIADINISEESGMGRIAWHWKVAFERRGYTFVHIGSNEIRRLPHRSLFPYAAYLAYRQIKYKPLAFLVHEPSSGVFLNRSIPTIVFSHGLERRAWQLTLQKQDGTNLKLRLKTKLLYPIWRLRQCDLGLRKAQKLLLSNTEDFIFAQSYYCRKEDDISIFRNGVYPVLVNEKNRTRATSNSNILFIGTWLGRKGISTLLNTAEILYKKGLKVRWILAGTGVERKIVLDMWPEKLRNIVEVIPKFFRNEESELMRRADIFVLPSFYEGQPLVLLQAMEAGLCCITTNCCGQKDVIQHDYNGLLYQPGNAYELCSLIELCLKDEQLRNTISGNAKLSMKDRTWDAVSEDIVNQTEETVNRSKIEVIGK